MRIDVRKYLFVGASEHKTAFLAACQRLGIVDFIDQKKGSSERLPKELSDVQHALHLLNRYSGSEKRNGPPMHTPEKVVKEVLELEKEIEKLEEEQRYLKLEIARIKPFGDFSLEDKEWIEKEGKRHIQFFASKQKDAYEDFLKQYPSLIAVARMPGLDYFVSVGSTKEIYPNLIEIHLEKPLGELQKRAFEAHEELKEKHQKLQELADFQANVVDYYIHLLNSHNLDSVENRTEAIIGDQIFAIQGWVPENCLEKLQEIIYRYAVHLEEVSVDDGERIPTHLVNQGMSEVGEDLVAIYDTPSHTDKDPSGWVLWVFALFFAMIVGDGGYGAIFVALAGFLWWRFPTAQGFGKRMIKLLALLGVFCVGWGILTSSFFGVDIAVNSPLRDISLTTYLAEKKVAYHFAHKDDVYDYWMKEIPLLKGLNNPSEILATAVKKVDGNIQAVMLDKFVDNIMLELSLFFGSIHVILGMLRYSRRSIANFGWILFVIGAYLFFPSVLDATSLLNFYFEVPKSFATLFGQGLLFAGVGLAVVLSLIQNRLQGAAEIANIIQIFADILSYLRLYALGLAGGIMSATFNDMGLAAGVYVGWMIILAGHVVNITLNVMSGVLHGLRLNFLEWYHYSFEGGGKAFKPLSLLKVPKGS